MGSLWAMAPEHAANASCRLVRIRRRRPRPMADSEMADVGFSELGRRESAADSGRRVCFAAPPLLLVGADEIGWIQRLAHPGGRAAVLGAAFLRETDSPSFRLLAPHERQQSALGNQRFSSQRSASIVGCRAVLARLSDRCGLIEWRSPTSRRAPSCRPCARSITHRRPRRSERLRQLRVAPPSRR